MSRHSQGERRGSPFWSAINNPFKLDPHKDWLCESTGQINQGPICPKLTKSGPERSRMQASVSKGSLGDSKVPSSYVSA